MANLLLETLDILRDNGLSGLDVRWCGILNEDPSRALWFSWAEFRSRANIRYSAGYGLEEINLQLVIVGDDWWLERAEYDGSEWWEFKRLPLRPAMRSAPQDLFSDSYRCDD